LATHSHSYDVSVAFTAIPTDGKVSIFDTATGERVSGPIPAGGGVEGFTFTDDGLAVQGVDQNAELDVWPLAGGAATSTQIDLGPDAALTDVSADRSLVAAAQGSFVQLYDMGTRGGLAIGSIQDVAGVAFDRRGRVVSVTSDGVVQIRSLDPRDWVAAACAIANRPLSAAEIERYLGEGATASGCT
jgi:hypothetical protein